MAGGDLFAAHTGQLSPSETEERQQTRHQTTDNRQQDNKTTDKASDNKTTDTRHQTTDNIQQTVTGHPGIRDSMIE